MLMSGRRSQGLIITCLIGIAAERADLGNLRHHNLGALERKDLYNTPHRRIDIVSARTCERFPGSQRVEPEGGPEIRSLVQPQDHRAAGAVAECAERLGKRLRELPDR
jgi:hypothetical protein